MHEGQCHRKIILIFIGSAYQDADASNVDYYGSHDNGSVLNRGHDDTDIFAVPGFRCVRQPGVEDHKTSDSCFCTVLPAEFPICNAVRGGAGIFLPPTHE